MCTFCHIFGSFCNNNRGFCNNNPFIRPIIRYFEIRIDLYSESFTDLPEASLYRQRRKYLPVFQQFPVEQLKIYNKGPPH